VYPNARCCLAIHNLAHQGSFETHAFDEVGLSGEWYSTLEWQSPDDRNRRKTVNILKVRQQPAAAAAVPAAGRGRHAAGVGLFAVCVGWLPPASIYVSHSCCVGVWIVIAGPTACRRSFLTC
jgi:hypothetical protein